MLSSPRDSNTISAQEASLALVMMVDPRYHPERHQDPTDSSTMSYYHDKLGPNQQQANWSHHPSPTPFYSPDQAYSTSSWDYRSTQVYASPGPAQPFPYYHSQSPLPSYQEAEKKVFWAARNYNPGAPISRPYNYCVEEQDSSSSGRSEPVDDQSDGFPGLDTFEEVIEKWVYQSSSSMSSRIHVSRYLDQLSDRKKDKALIPAERAQDIKKVLKDPKTTAVATPQFRLVSHHLVSSEENPRRRPSRQSDLIGS